MKITTSLFQAYIKCPTKCWLKFTGEPATGNAYADWVNTKNESYRTAAIERMRSEFPQEEWAVAPAQESLTTSLWRLGFDVFVATSQNLETRLDAVERVPPEGRGKSTRFIPIRFVYTNKLNKDDKLPLAFDASVLSEMLRREVSVGKIIHGDNHATLNVKTPTMLAEVRKRLDKIAALLSNSTPPDLILNRNCAECEFQARCKQKAIEKDDLSLLSNMKEKERKQFNTEGTFTVTQLSYTFRPRRRPKRLRDKQEKYHHALKALAIREKKIHIVGAPELKIDGTPIYLDVESLPDRDFYYLIGVRMKTGDAIVQHSFWADDIEDERRAWTDFLGLLSVVKKPVLVHYGSFETTFLRRLSERYGEPQEESGAANAIKTAVNLVTVIFAHVYFPSYSNGLKDVAGYLGFVWSEPKPSGLSAICWRHAWETTGSLDLKSRLLKYNAEDCLALETVAAALLRLGPVGLEHEQRGDPDHAVVHTELLPQKTMWPRFSSPILEFEQINKAARWSYQRDRVYVRSSKRIRKMTSRVCPARKHKINKRITCPDQPLCPRCGRRGFRHFDLTTLILHDLFFGSTSMKKWVVEYRFHFHWCRACRIRFGLPNAFWPGTKFGRRPGTKFGKNLIAYVVYQAIELYIPQCTITRSLARLFGYHFSATSQVHLFKVGAAEFYAETRRQIVDRIVRGSLVHVDETKANIRGKTACVWVFTNLHEVAYLYSDSRDSETARTTLAAFNGVLVSDFYSGYDSLACAQQKCLLHLVRDLNAEILSYPYDEELKLIIMSFARLLKEAVATVDRFGLKKHFLHKHLKSVDRFYDQMEGADIKSEAALKCKQRFEKNREKLFTFLDYDGVPWNNNNAEHAIKAFAALRDVMEGSSTQKGTEDYLILLSVCQTCKYSGVDFLDFLRSGEKDIQAFAENQPNHRRAKAGQPF
jgi:predicted RecB family nuclease